MLVDNIRVVPRINAGGLQEEPMYSVTRAVSNPESGGGFLASTLNEVAM